MSMQEARKDLKKTISIARPNANKVIMTVYVAKPRNYSSRKTYRKNNAKPNPLLKRSKNTNRRAELLAYARDLRAGNSYKRQEWQPGQNSRPNFKKGKWSSLTVRMRTSFQKIFLRKEEEECRYERMASCQNSEERQFVHSCRKKKTQNFYRKLKRLLKKLSCGLQRSKG